MFTIKDEIILVSMSELRTEMPKIRKHLTKKVVIVTSRGKPVAVLEDYDTYKKKEDFLDEMTDVILGLEAKKRHEKSKPGDYISHEEMLKRLNNKL